MNEPTSRPSPQVFTHDAMHTTFSLRILAPSAADAAGMARECADRLELLESRLSRFIEGSDVARINRLQAGEVLHLSDECHRCLQAAHAAWLRTGGLFDVSLGTRIAHRKEGRDGPPPPLAGSLELDPLRPMITCHEPGRELDLGGIGKGFALDELKALLLDWGAAGGLLAAGASTIVAFGAASWPVELRGARGCRRLDLCEAALGASGTAVQGCHIIDPRDPGPAGGGTAWPRVWVVAATGAEADAWSTAAILLDADGLAAALDDDPSLAAIFVERADGILEIGAGAAGGGGSGG